MDLHDRRDYTCTTLHVHAGDRPRSRSKTPSRQPPVPSATHMSSCRVCRLEHVCHTHACRLALDSDADSLPARQRRAEQFQLRILARSGAHKQHGTRRPRPANKVASHTTPADAPRPAVHTRLSFPQEIVVRRITTVTPLVTLCDKTRTCKYIHTHTSHSRHK